MYCLASRNVFIYFLLVIPTFPELICECQFLYHVFVSVFKKMGLARSHGKLIAGIRENMYDKTKIKYRPLNINISQVATLVYGYRLYNRITHICCTEISK